jgi:hypothetical protein
MRTGVTDGLKSINAYYKAAMMLPVEQLQAIVRGTDKGSAVRIPATIAMMALEAKMPQVTAAQGQQAIQQPQQPSVRDELAQKVSMLPENIGVGALPAQNMESMDMAEGGIVAFKDKGFVDTATEYMEDKLLKLPTLPGWNAPALPILTGATYGEDVRRSLEDPNTSSTIGRIFAPVKNAVSGFLSTPSLDPAAQQQLENLDKQVRALSARRKELVGTLGFQQQTKAQQAEAARIDQQINNLRQQGEALKNRGPQTTAQSSTLEQFQAPPPVKKEAGWAVEGTTPGRRVVDKKGNVKFIPGQLSRALPPINEGDVYTHRPLPPNSPYLDPNTYQNVGGPFNLKTEAGRNAAANQRRGVVTQNNKDVPTTETKRDGSANNASTAPAATSDLKSLIKDVTDASGANKIAEGYTGIERLIEKQNQDELKRYKERPQYEPYKKYEESLKSEEEKVKDKKNENFQLALINAGLAIAGGSSRYALQNIGQGAQVGTKQYAEGLKTLEAAAKERQKAFAMIEEARNAKAEKDFDRYDTMMNRQSERAIRAKELGIEGLAKVLNITVPQATNIYTTLKTNASREAIAAANDQVQREKIAADERGNLLQYKVGMANAASNAGYRDAMLEQNMIQKRLMAEQRGQTAYNDFLGSYEGKALSAKAMTDPNASKYLRDVRNHYIREAYTGVGLPYDPIKNPSDSGFKVLGPVK